MRIAPQLLSLVELTLSDYLNEPTLGDADFARRYRALPLYAGWTGITYLTASGEFWFRNHEYDPPRIENNLNDASKIVALVLASERHPELVRLLPTRPRDAVDCEDCAGKGRITVGDVSNIICGQCSARGWRVSPGVDASDVESYVSFDAALAKFRAFASEHGLPTQLAFLSADHSLAVGDQLHVTEEAFGSDAVARNTYERAVACRLGVAVGALGELPDGRLGIYVYGPTTENEAERLMYPRGLKMTVPERRVRVRVVSRLRMWFQRLRYGHRAATQTREHFR